jgi:acyl-CoA synthetase (AMP-forming)/AMP-acid ligase II
MVTEAAARNPDGEALICGSERLTWREVARKSMQIAAGFKEIGLARRSVALLLGNRNEFVLSLFGAAHLGLVSVMLSTVSRSRKSPMS